MKVSRKEINSYFKTGAKPTEQQFKDTHDSFRHKDDGMSNNEIEEIKDIVSQEISTKKPGILSEANSNAETKDAQVLSTAKSYTDTKTNDVLNAAKAYTDDQSSGGGSSLFEKVTSGSKIGITLKDAENKRNIGNQAFCLSLTGQPKGNGSFVGPGCDCIANQAFSFVVAGMQCTAMDYYSAAGGYQNHALKYASTAIGGRNNVAKGNYSCVDGGLNKEAASYAEHVVGCNNTTYTPVSANEFAHEDRIFVVGNGTSKENRSNAMVVYKNGNIDINGVMKLKPTTEPATAQAGQVYFDVDSNKLRCYDGTTWHDLF